MYYGMYHCTRLYQYQCTSQYHLNGIVACGIVARGIVARGIVARGIAAPRRGIAASRHRSASRHVAKPFCMIQ